MKQRIVNTIIRGKTSRKHRSRLCQAFQCYFHDNLTFYVVCQIKRDNIIVRTVIMEQAGLGKCFNCGKRKLVKTAIRHKKMEFDGWKCSACRQSFFTEERFSDAFIKIQQRRLKESYVKDPIQVGHSLAVTFPEDIVEVFNLKKKKIELKPDLRAGSIHLRIISQDILSSPLLNNYKGLYRLLCKIRVCLGKRGEPFLGIMIKEGYTWTSRTHSFSGSTRSASKM